MQNKLASILTFRDSWVAAWLQFKVVAILDIDSSFMLPSDSLMSNLYSQLGCSIREFHALQLIGVYEVFGAVD